jgi:hypothetical protein
VPTDLDAWKQRLETLEHAGPDASPAEANILAGELRAAHKTAIRDLDAAAARLNRDHGKTWTELCIAIYNRPNKVKIVRERGQLALDNMKVPRMPKAKAEAAFADHRDRVAELATLYKRASTIRNATSTAPARSVDEIIASLDLPDDPVERERLAAERITEYRAEAEKLMVERNRTAAALVQHAGWTKAQAAKLVGRDRGRLDFEQETRPEEADPERGQQLENEAKRVRDLGAAWRTVRLGAEASVD